MRLHLIGIGRIKAGPECELIDQYLARSASVGRGLGVSVDMHEIEESRSRRPQDRKTEEAQAIRRLLGHLPGAAPGFIACDAAGESLSTAGFAARLDGWRQRGTGRLAMILGGPDGLDRDLCAEAALILAFGAMTWPHRLARIMAAEQVYRALTLLAGHPYHRA